MTVHLVKLAVGIESPDHLGARQQARLEALEAAGEPAVLEHRTRHMPRRRQALLEGGSLYWVIRGAILVRQRLADIREIAEPDGTSRCALVLDPLLVPVRPQPRRPFQGWRYLEVSDAPPDLAPAEAASGAALSPAMRAALIELALL